VGLARGIIDEQRRRPLRPHAKGWLACALSFAAGVVDAVGWLLLFHVFTSHMSGNTVSWGIALARGEAAEAIRHGWPLVPFVLGLLFSAATTAAARRHGWHSSFSIALITEFALLASFLWLATQYPLSAAPGFANGPGFYLITALPAAAMGIQTVTVTRVAGLRVYTTYVTGTLSKWAEAVVAYGYWVRDRARGRGGRRWRRILRVTPRQSYARHAVLTTGLWAAYFAGGLSGAMLETRYGANAVVVSLIVLAAAIVVDLAAPVAAADEPGSFDDL
jgi:uncharacterized membrane protein YoaK (UPF0700 family)